MLHLPRVMFAAPSSGSGKTMITCGVLAAMCRRHLRPASFKCGPDYIDPMFHARVIGTPSKNLDTFFTDRETTRYLFAKTAAKAGISVLEGVMGMYDGLGGISLQASSYDLARVTETPVILIINARGMSLSVIPMIQGYVAYQKSKGPGLIRGVILNQAAKSTYLLLKEEIERQTGVKVYGYVPVLKDAAVQSRHLGLVTPGEIADLKRRLDHLGGEMEQTLALDQIVALAQEAPDYADQEAEIPQSVWQAVSAFCGEKSPVCADKGQRLKTDSKRLAVAEDEAFCFYYQDNLDLLELAGTEIVSFSPLHDSALPEDIDGMLLGGGYPELYAEQLSENRSMKESIHRAASSGLPYLAECGGFMYLHETMEDMQGQAWPMCGCIPGRSYHTAKLGRFGYITLQRRQKREKTDFLCAEGFLTPEEVIRAHEFHYFDSTDPGSACTAKKPMSGRKWDCMHVTDHSAAGYPHLYYWSNPLFALRFSACMAEWSRKRRQKSKNE